MAKLKNGILGGFSGTVGTVVGASWRGVDYMRSKITKRRSTELTAQQIEHQQRFSLMVSFLRTMQDLLKVGYKDFGQRMTEFNSALGYNIKAAIMGQAPDYTIVYPQVLVTRGSLPNAGNPTAMPGAAGTVKFNWTDNSNLGKAKGTDKAILVVYCEALKHTEYIIGALRSAGTADLSVPGLSGQSVQTWISFITENKKDVATSIFTGEVNVA